MKTLLLLVVAGALLAAPVAYARDWRGGFGAVLQAQGQPLKQERPRQRGEPRKREEQDKRHHKEGRLTQEERRNLHRDLDRANREIYRR